MITLGNLKCKRRGLNTSTTLITLKFVHLFFVLFCFAFAFVCLLVFKVPIFIKSILNINAVS